MYVRYKIKGMKDLLVSGPYWPHEVEVQRRDIEGFEGIEWTKVFEEESE